MKLTVDGRESGKKKLQDPVVPPEAYDAEYFLHCCMGSDAWEQSNGRDTHPMYAGYAARAHIGPDDVLVDFGTGRAEMPVVAVQHGARQAIGLEYSSAALQLARRTVAAANVGDRATVIHADVRKAPIDDGVATVVTMLDIVEHLAETELNDALSEVVRVLGPGGRLLIHTAPNRWIYDIAYRGLRLAAFGRGWPAQPRNDAELRMHVNEQSRGRLKKTLTRAGLENVEVWHGDWIYTDFIPGERTRRAWARMAGLAPLRFALVGDIWATATKPKKG